MTEDKGWGLLLALLETEPETLPRLKNLLNASTTEGLLEYTDPRAWDLDDPMLRVLF